MNIPQTDIHKLVGWLASVVVFVSARYGINLPLEIAIILLNITFLGVSTLVGKRTNPTGANKSETRQVLEHVVKQSNTGEFDAQVR